MCYSPILKRIRKQKVDVVKRLPSHFIEIRKKSCFEKKAWKDFVGNYGTYLVRAKRIFVDDLTKPNEYVFELPCGKCADCLNRIVNQWSFRISKDIEQENVRAFFITLTYRPEERCTTINMVDKRTGEIKPLKNRNFIRPSKFEFIDFAQNDPLNSPDVNFEDVYINQWNIQKGYRKSFYWRVHKSFQGKVEGYEKVEYDDNFLFYYGPKTRIEYSSQDEFCSELAEFKCENGFLNYDDVQKFIKRIRRMLEYYYGIKYLKYFCCGEYTPPPHYEKGRLTEGFLPHYHMLLWYKETPKAVRGYIKQKKDNRYKGSTYGITQSKLYSDYIKVLPLTSALFHDFVYRAWSKSSIDAFVCSPVRSVVGASRYISKYILKAVKGCNYKDNIQSQRPFKRWMSSGIGKAYAHLIASGVCSNFQFGYQDGEYFKFFPSIMVKWMYSHDVEIQKDDFLKWYDNEKYFVMFRKREEYIKNMEEPSIADIENKQIKINNMFASMPFDNF